MIIVGDFVNVSLAEGGFFEGYEVIDVPGQNAPPFWTLESPDGKTVVVGPSFISMTKVS